MLDLSEHRINPVVDTDWYYDYEKKMGEKEFRSYINRVYGELMALPEGKEFSIEDNVCPQNYDLFVKIGCLFVCEMKNENFEFNSRFTVIRRLKMYVKHEKTEKKECTKNG